MDTTRPQKPYFGPCKVHSPSPWLDYMVKPGGCCRHRASGVFWLRAAEEECSQHRGGRRPDLRCGDLLLTEGLCPPRPPFPPPLHRSPGKSLLLAGSFILLHF